MFLGHLILDRVQKLRNLNCNVQFSQPYNIDWDYSSVPKERFVSLQVGSNIGYLVVHIIPITVLF
jgi:hypothetical protein